MEGHGERLEALERKTKVTEALVYEISYDPYKNGIRVVPKPRVKAIMFNEEEKIPHKTLPEDTNCYPG